MHENALSGETTIVGYYSYFYYYSFDLSRDTKNLIPRVLYSSLMPYKAAPVIYPPGYILVDYIM